MVQKVAALRIKSVRPAIAVTGLSVVSSPYEVDGQVVGTLGVIGPTRMPYDRMIQIVDITARLVGNALSTK